MTIYLSDTSAFIRFLIHTALHCFVLSGSIPEVIGNLKKLETLALQNNQLTSLPRSISQLTHLRDLNLSNNRIAAFPVQLSALRNLDSLNLSHNKLTKLPDELRGLQTVELNLNNNQVSIST